jgi:hypothetical protein
MSISIVTFVDSPLTAGVPRPLEVCLYVLGASLAGASLPRARRFAISFGDRSTERERERAGPYPFVNLSRVPLDRRTLLPQRRD